MSFKSVISVLVVLLLGLGLTSCGPKAFTRGDYDDVNRENLLDDQWSETDMQKAVQFLVGSMTGHNTIKAARKPPIIMVTRLQNKTSEHIDTQSITDMITVELTNSGRVSFVDKEARDDVEEEYKYQGSGAVSGESRKERGGQIGADYIINGRLDSITKEVGNKKTVYYKITLRLTNLKTNIVAWTNHKQIRKKFKKRRIGL